jgi:lipoprotein signal peptidase
VVAGLVLDLWSKHWAFANLASGETRTIWPSVLEFRRSLNAGAVFGSFTGQTGLFVVASLFALIFVLYLFVRSDRRQYGLHIALGLILSGATGNLYDRAFIIADVVHHQPSSGRVEMIIGSMRSSAGDQTIRIGDWPDGAHPRTLRRSEVTIQKLGVVRDFIKFVPRFPQWVPKLAGRDVWPWVFNVADSALVCGVGLLLISSWFGRKLYDQPS